MGLFHQADTLVDAAAMQISSQDSQLPEPEPLSPSRAQETQLEAEPEARAEDEIPPGQPLAEDVESLLEDSQPEPVLAFETVQEPQQNPASREEAQSGETKEVPPQGGETRKEVLEHTQDPASRAGET